MRRAAQIILLLWATGVAAQPRPNDFIYIPPIRFAGHSAALPADSKALLDELARWLKESPEHGIQVRGCTDRRLSSRTGRGLGYLRAQAVVDALVKRGVEPQRLEPVGVGPDEPVCLDDTKECRAKNNRVDFRVTDRIP